MAEKKEDAAFATLVFARHGQSEWNASNQFTGWVDVGLTDLGRTEAKNGAGELKKGGYQFDIMFTSYLKRAILTGNMILEEIDQSYIPVKRSWRLNERMYGGLQGLNKVETVEKHGKEQVLKWRRSFDIPPPEIDEKSEYNPANEAKYKKFCDAKDIPKTECLKDVIARAEPYWKSDIEPELKAGKTVLVAAHGNSIRAIVKYLDKIDDATIPSLEIPTGIPLVYRFDKDLNIIKNEKATAPLSGVFLGDPAAIKAAQEKVKNQVSKKAAGGDAAPGKSKGAAGSVKAVCMLAPDGDSGVSGKIVFEAADKGTKITGTITGLKPGKHGFHIHELGDLSGGCKTAKGHFNPFAKTHGGPSDEERHVGDLGNITADDKGVANIDCVDPLAELNGDNSIIGRSVVVHAGVDDLGKGGFEDSKTTGHAGGRVACGVIGRGN